MKTRVFRKDNSIRQSSSINRTNTTISQNGISVRNIYTTADSVCPKNTPG